MDALKSIPVIIFFAVFLGIIAAAYLFNSINPPQRLPQRIDEIGSSTSGFITVSEQAGGKILQTGLPVYVDDEFINKATLRYIKNK
ncbi:MAG TPA: hypothetical protein PKN87_06100 [Syntrophomonadaceae bacterium]|nr:hypothetical protein [Syntrophomonadaceae bacterium]HPR93724.1 hypothetical protein [Syntrophomonadaceae bacterium]